MTRLRAVLLIEEGPAALKQVAATVGFANAMGLKLSLVPEEEPRSDTLKWGNADAKVPKDDLKMIVHAKKVMGEDAMHRKEFVRAVSKLSGTAAKTVGATVSRWVRLGVMVEVPS